MNLQQCRDKVSQSLGYEDWKELRADQSNLSDAGFDLIVTNVSKMYAEEKVKEALKLSAEEAVSNMQGCDYSQRNECKKNVLSLEEELINKMKKEI